MGRKGGVCRIGIGIRDEYFGGVFLCFVFVLERFFGEMCVWVGVETGLRRGEF